MKTKLRKLLGLTVTGLFLLGCNNADNTARPPLPGPVPQATPEVLPGR